MLYFTVWWSIFASLVGTVDNSQSIPEISSPTTELSAALCYEMQIDEILDAECSNSNGKLRANVIPGGCTNPTFTYNWSNGETTEITNLNLLPGAYHLTVTEVGSGNSMYDRTLLVNNASEVSENGGAYQYLSTTSLCNNPILANTTCLDNACAGSSCCNDNFRAVPTGSSSCIACQTTSNCSLSYSMRWQRSASSPSTGYVNIAGAAAGEHIYTPVLSGYYRVHYTYFGESYFTSYVQVTECTCDNYSSPGTISANQVSCGSFNPAEMTGSAPAGGSGGSPMYQWQSRSPGGTWQNIAGAISASFNPNTISSTTEYHRGVKRPNCPTYIYSNTVTKTVTPIPSAPTTTNVTVCEGETATLSASGCAGGTYRWYASSNGTVWVHTGPTWDLSSCNQARSALDVTCTYYVSCFLNNCESARTPVTATWLTFDPVIGVTQGTTICEGTPVYICVGSLSGQSQTDWSYSWTPGGSEPTNLCTTFEPGPTTSTTYSVWVTKPGCAGKQRTQLVTVEVCCDEVTNGGLINGGQVGCGSSVTLTNMSNSQSASGSSSFEYRWRYSDNNGSSWVTENVNQSSYDPSGSVSTPRLYRREARGVGCTGGWTPSNQVLFDPVNFSINCTSPTDVTTAGGSNGTIQLLISGGDSQYAVSWSGASNGSTTVTSSATLGGFSVGNYNLTVTDANNCTDNCSFTISGPTCDEVTNGGQINGGQVGCGSSVTLTNMSNSQGASGSSSFEYRWRYSDNNGSSWVTENVNQASYDPSGSVSSPRLYRREARGINCTGGWTPSNQVLFDPVNFSINCNSPTEVSTVGGSDGTIQLILSGGDSQYAVSWSGASNGSTTVTSSATLGGFSVGNYNLTVTAANNCTDNCSFTISGPSCDEVTNGGQINGGQVGCGSSVTLTNMSNSQSASGSSSFEYRWRYSDDNGSSWVTENVNQASYDPSGSVSSPRLYRREARGINCTGGWTPSNQVLFDPVNFSINCTSPTEVSTVGGSDGTIQLIISGGDSQYAVSWSGASNGSTTVTSSATLGGFSVGNYNLTVTDANNCTDNCSFTISGPSCAGFSAGLVVSQEIDCNGGSNGALNLTVTGGDGTYNYTWSGPTAIGNIQDPTGLSAGAYSVIVSDNSGCQTSANITLLEPTAVSISCTPSDVSTSGASDGEIEIMISGGTANYTVSWSGTATGALTNQTSPATISNLVAGSYDIIVTDANGCTDNCSATINQPSCAGFSRGPGGESRN